MLLEKPVVSSYKLNGQHYYVKQSYQCYYNSNIQAAVFIPISYVFVLYKYSGLIMFFNCFSVSYYNASVSICEGIKKNKSYGDQFLDTSNCGMQFVMYLIFSKQTCLHHRNHKCDFNCYWVFRKIELSACFTKLMK